MFNKDKFGFETTIRYDDYIVRDHRVYDVRIMPGVTFLDMVYRVLETEGKDPSTVELRNIIFKAPVAVAETYDKCIRLLFEKKGAHIGISASSRKVRDGKVLAEDWDANFECELHQAPATSPAAIDVAALKAASAEKADLDVVYQAARKVAINHYEFMKGQGQLYKSAGYLLADIRVSPLAAEQADNFYLHPALLDASTFIPFQFYLSDQEKPFIPIFIESFRAVAALQGSCWVYAVENSQVDLSRDIIHGDYDIHDSSGMLVASFRRLTGKRIRSAALISGQEQAGQEQQEATAPEARIPPPVAKPAADDLLQYYIQQTIGALLQVDAEEIAPDAPFYDQGLDSKALVQLSNIFGEKIGARLYPTLLFEYANVEELAAYFRAHHADWCGSLLQEQAVPEDHPAAMPEATSAAVMQQPVAAVQPPAGRDRDIAIVGVSGRYPQASNLHEFWENIRNGKNCITEIPPERWDHAPFFSTAWEKGKAYGKWGGFVPDVDKFDPLFFQMSPAEATKLDPQLRLMLEVSWEVLEDAGYTRHALGSKRVGVFTGVMNSDFTWMAADSYHNGQYASPGSYGHEIANRISYLMNFRGPSITLETACASSLTAIHLARKALLDNECDVALAGGVNLHLHPSKFLMLSDLRIISPDGREKTFDAAADGYVPGDGAGMVMLKPLQEAIADGDHIYGIIAGSAINHSGTGAGHYVPNVKALSEVAEKSLQEAGIHPGELSYIEMHGTGTALGDPIEVQALANVFDRHPGKKEVCALGSRANIGHLESASGICALTKVLLSMQHGQIAGCANVENINPAIPLTGSSFYIPAHSHIWESHGRPRVAGINSFGIGGSNCFMVIKEREAEKETAAQPASGLFILSARSEERLKAYVQRFVDFISRKKAAGGNIPFSQLLYTLQTGREPMPWRLAMIVSGIDDLHAKLQAFLAGDGPQEGCWWAQADGKTPKKERAVTVNKPLEELAAVWVKGADIQWEQLYAGNRAGRTPLPSYPFERRRCWLEATIVNPLPAAKELPRPAEELLFISNEWEEKPLATPEGKADGGWVLVLNDGTVAPENISGDHAVKIINVQMGKTFGNIGPLAYEIDPASPGDYTLLFNALAEKQALPVKVMHLWEGKGFVTAIPLLREQLQHSLYSLYYLTRELIRHRQRAGIVFGFIADSYALKPQYAALHAWARTLEQESPGIRLGVVQMETGVAPLLRCNILLDELAAGCPDAQVSYNNGRRWINTWKEAPAAPLPEDEMHFREGGTYLITGGAGGLGLVFARHIAASVKAHIILVGRSALTAEKQQELQEIGAGRAHIRYYTADISNNEELRRLCCTIRKQYGNINGIMHCAGITRDELILHKRMENIAEVTAAKVDGTIFLDGITRHEKLDHFILFSSTAAIFGNAGQADYAYANAFLDFYARHREQLREDGLRNGKTIVINWPLWEHTGMQLDSDTLQHLYNSIGVKPITREEGTRILRYALGNPTCQTIALKGDVEKLTATYRIGRAAAGSGNAVREAEQLLRKVLSEETGLSIDEILVDEPLEQYGIDSLMITNITTRLEKTFGKLSKTIFFEYQHIAGLAQYLAARYPGKFEQQEALPAMPPAASKPAAVPQEKGPHNGDADNEIAIIGISGRYPGAADLQEFWRNLAAGRDCISEIPPDRWHVHDYFDPQKGRKGKTYGKWGGFLDDIDKFDPLFFNIAPADAGWIDPQERLFLQTAWHVVEDAGYTRKELEKCRVGVYVGVMYGEYLLLGVEHGAAAGVRMSYGSIANRVSYFFNFSGPSMAIDTMCSSSLTAIHLACESMLRGEADMAIAGGVNIMLHPSKYITLSQDRFISSDGRCRSFGEGGDGYVPGEGVGAVLLKPRKRAEADGDHIYAVIKASTVNHGGKTNGYTVPNPVAQHRLIEETWRKAGISPESISYIEAHGTGTGLGDPVEIAGISNACKSLLNGHGNGQQYCAIGSVKSNVGHLESAAGIAGITKVVLQMRHRKLVPSLHAARLNPDIDFSETFLRVQQELQEWKNPAVQNGTLKILPRIAGISSFGAGGSNAHIILEEYNMPYEPAGPSRKHIVPLSAQTLPQLMTYAGKLAAFLDAPETPALPGYSIGNIAYSLQTGREMMEERVAFVVDSLAALVSALSRFAAGETDMTGVYYGRISKAGKAAGGEEAAAVIASGDPDRVAGLWAAGAKITREQWLAMGRGSKVPLPGYPFLEERYWLDMTGAQEKQGAAAGVPCLHPLVHRNVSTFRELKYTAVFGKEHYCLADHVVNGDRILPGAAILEMAKCAGELANNGATITSIRNIAWYRAVALRAAEERMDIDISFVQLGDRVRFELKAAAAPAGQYCAQGELDYGALPPPPENKPLQELLSQCTEKIEGQECYDHFRKQGIIYGNSFQTIQALHRGRHMAVAFLQLPAKLAEDFDRYSLHPSLVDGAFQSILGACYEAARQTPLLYLPYAMDALEIYRPLVSSPIVYVQHLASADDSVLRFDLLLLDGSGQALLGIRNFCVKCMPVASPASALLFSPGWQQVIPSVSPAAQPTPAAGLTIVFITPSLVPAFRKYWKPASGYLLLLPGNGYAVDGQDTIHLDPADSNDYAQLLDHMAGKQYRVSALLYLWAAADHLEKAPLEEQLQAGFFSLFHFIREAGCRKLLHHVKLLYAYIAAPVVPALEAGIGLVKTISRENPGIKSRSVALPAGSFSRDRQAGTLQWLYDELAGSFDTATEVRYKDQQRQVKVWEELPGLAAAGNDPAFSLRESGVYLVTGGLGALGSIFAAYLLKKGNVKVILTGRSQPGPARQEQLAALQQLGEVRYIPADISQKDALAALLDTIHTLYGPLNGIIHAAGVIRDAYILNKHTQEINEVWAPKVQGTILLDQLTREDELDFFVLCSSAVVAHGNEGQSDYAFANSFMDSFAHRREAARAAGERSGKTVTINWPLWAEGGMTVHDDVKHSVYAATGLLPLSTTAGLAALEAILKGTSVQTMVLAGDRNRLTAFLNPVAQEPAESLPPVPAPAGIPGKESLHDRILLFLKKMVCQEMKIPLERLSVTEPLQHYGLDSIKVMNMNNELERHFKALPKTLFYEYQQLDQLAAYFTAHQHEQLLHQFAAPAPAVPGNEITESPIREMAVQQPAQHRDAGAQHGDIAIIGISGRYPQAANLDEFWQNLLNGRDCVITAPQERWSPEELGIGMAAGGFISDIDKFDPLFFNISPKEAAAMDPQERIFLETAWHTMEDAGYNREALVARQVGVFVGVMYAHYQLFSVAPEYKGADGFVPSSLHAAVANRVSYVLGLTGPSIALDTMCSSSLTAIHLACNSIRLGECDMALAGGVNLSIHPNKYLSLSRGQFLAGNGRCKSFGEGGDGYVPGEGAGAVLLKPLHKAKQDGDHIYGVIKGSAINHGGRANAYTVPNPAAQKEVILKALQQAGVMAQELDYLEAHGTGTTLGDPIEISALTQAFTARDGAQRRQSCPIGSVKSNIGHLEAAAGIAAITKVLWQFRHRTLVPSIHAEQLNANIPFPETPFYVQTSLQKWEKANEQLPLRAGVSSFGAGGANCHVIMEAYTDHRPAIITAAAGIPPIVVLSARNEERLRAYAGLLASYLQQRENGPDTLPDDIYTLQTGREALDARMAFVASEEMEVVQTLKAFSQYETPAIHVYMGNLREMPELLPEAPANSLQVQDAVGRQDWRQVAMLWVNGAPVAWQSLYDTLPVKPRRTTLPGYPFERTAHWLKPRQAAAGTPPVSMGNGPLPATQKTDIMLKDFFYLPEWRVIAPASLPAAGHDVEKNILILHQGGALPEELAALCRDQRVVQHAMYDIENIPAWLLQQQGHFDAVYFLAGAPQAPLSRLDRETYRQSGVFILFRLVKALAEAGYEHRRLLLTAVLQNTCTAAGEQAEPLEAGVIGFMNALNKEYARWNVCCIDAGTPQGIEETRALAGKIKDISRKVTGREIRIRNGECYMRAFRPIELVTDQARDHLKHRGVYVILGGGGGIGLEFSLYLARHYQARIALIGRSPLNDRQREKIALMESHGAEVMYVMADATDRQEMHNAMQKVLDRFHHINGAIHSAIVLDDRLVVNMQEEQLSAVLAPKVQGCIYFYEALKQVALDFMLFFSSAQSFSCNPGQSNYAAACTFEDAYAAYLSQVSAYPVKVVNWGYWGSVGIVATEAYNKRLAAQGIGAITVEEGMEAIRLVLMNDVRQVMGIRLRKDLLMELGVDFGVPAAASTPPKPAAPDSLQIEQAITGIIAHTLNIPEKEIDPRRAFAAIGIDSIVGVELINAINEHFGIALRTTALFDYSNTRELAGFIREHHALHIPLVKEQAPPAHAEALDAGLPQKVIVYRPSAVSELQTVTFQPAAPDPYEVQVQVQAFSLNFGDLLCVKGLYPTMPDYPFTPGFELAGTVVSTGAAVSRVKAGDAVIGLANTDLGAHASLVNLHEMAVVRKPGNVTMEEACSFPIVYMTMQRAFDLAGIQPGDKVLVQTAAGGTGLITVQMAQQLGAEIYATAGSPEKLEYLRKLGIKYLVNYREEDFETRILQMTGNKGVDVVFNTLSGDAIQKGMRLLAPGGRYIEIAMTGLKSAKQIDLSCLTDNQSLYSVDLRKIFLQDAAVVSGYLDRMAATLEKGEIRPTVGKVFGFAAVKEAYQYLENRGNIGKVVVSLQATGQPLQRAESNRPAAAHEAVLPADNGTAYTDIAIIGMAGRFPQAADLDAFWQNLVTGRNAVTEVPPERWDIEQYYDPDPAKLDKTHCRKGGFLSGIDRFDPVFFNMSGKEARLTDPQQRLFLEESWKALEDAGYATEKMENTRCGIFVGAGKSDYVDKMQEAGAGMEAQSFWGNEESVLPARLAYFLNLKGACMVVNTACSSSLAAIHLACQSLLSGESTLAVAGGVFVRTMPAFHIINSNAQMLSATGKCQAFDDNADGYVPGEGIGVIVLKKLDRAIADGDNIHAVIKGSGMNQDGRTNGITAPSTRSQTALEAQVYDQYHIHPDSIGLAEAHGTGTKLGDPIEVEALTNAFRQFTQRKGYCAIGSVKANIGHAVTAAGIASVLKATLALKNRVLPPAIHYQQPNRHIDFTSSPFYVNTAPVKWEGSAQPRRACISSFGFSGTNVHMVLEEAPPLVPVERPRQQGPYLLLLSAKTEKALSGKIDDLLLFLSGGNGQPVMEDLAYSLCCRRMHFPVRLAFLADTVQEAVALLKTIQQKGPLPAGCFQRNLRTAPCPPAREDEQLQEQTLEALALPGTSAGDRYEKLLTLARLFTEGREPDWSLLFRPGTVKFIPLPAYPFEHGSYWITGRQQEQGTGTATLQPFTRLFSTGHPVIRDHQVQQQGVLPGVVYIELAFAALAQQQEDYRHYVLHDIVWLQPCIVKDNVRVKVSLQQQDREKIKFEITAEDNGKVYAQGAFIYRSAAASCQLSLEGIRQRCVTAVVPAALYAAFEEGNIQYGHWFRGIQELHANGNECLARVEIPSAPADECGDYLLHPSLMDSAIQTTTALMTTAGDKALMLPYTIAKVELIRPLAATMFVHTVRKEQEGHFDIFLADREGNVAVRLTGLVLRKVMPKPAGQQPVWPGMPVVEQPVVAAYVAAMKRLEAFGRVLLLAAFRKMGVFQSAGEQYEAGLLKKQIGLAPRFDHLLDALLEIMQQAGFITVNNNVVTTLPALESVHTLRLEAEKDRLVAAHPEIKAHITLLWACVLKYPDILAGRLPATDVIFPASSMELVENIYKGNALADYFNDVVAGALLHFIRNAPGNDRIRILEVGAGLGGTSARVFNVLKSFGNRLSYFYTDISTGFLHFGKRSYGGENAYVEFKLLNIEQDVVQQGFDAHSFDVVLATNVLHATRDIAVTLGNIGCLLKPGGWLIINEVTSVEDFTTLTFGLLDGWWLYKDGHRRIKGSPLLAPSQWKDALSGSRFTPVQVFDISSNDNTAIGQQVMIAATAVPEPERASPKVNENDLADLIERRIIDITASVLQMDRDIFNIDVPYVEFGVDSLLAVDIINKLNAALDIELRSTDLFNFSTIRKLTEYIIASHGHSFRQLLPHPEQAPADVAPPLETAVAGIIAGILRIGEADISPDLPFADCGLDLQDAGRICEALNSKYGQHLRVTDLFNYSTVGNLCRHLVPEDEGGRQEVAVNVLNGSASLSAADTDIAVIGMSGRFPGADNIGQFWDNLSKGVNAVKEITRWDTATFYSPEAGTPDRSYCRHGALMDDIYRFDPLFFNISPHEAIQMDPQQRLFLEEAWKALENAGYTDKMLEQQKCSLFVGCTSGDYAARLRATGQALDGYTFTGNSSSILAARLSYFLNLKGASVAVDTACSSSLIAIHLACERIIRNKNEMAVAGGVAVMNTPDFYKTASHSGMLSPTGQCYTFDERADGFVPGEAVGVVILKSLEAAIRDGDTIHGIIKGSDINQDGKTNGITAPSAPSQTALECEVYERFGIDPSTISYMEAHGTGTRLGDPIEVQALTDAFKRYTTRSQFCAIGSVKTNIGHSLTAAGAAGLIKILLCFKHRQLAPSLNYHRTNPHIDITNSPFYVNDVLKDWHTDAAPRRAAISSFGFSGTNAHMVLEEPPVMAGRQIQAPRPYYLVALSAKTVEALEKRLRDLEDYIQKNNDAIVLKDLSFSLLLRRTHFPLKVALVVQDIRELCAALLSTADALQNGTLAPQEAAAKEKRAALEEQGEAVLAGLTAGGRDPLKYRDALETLAQGYAAGGNLPWAKLFDGEEVRYISIPAYPFAREYYEVYSYPLITSGNQPAGLYRAVFSGHEYLLREHVIGQNAILPATACIEILCEAAGAASGKRITGLKDVTWIHPVMQPLHEPVPELAVRVSTEQPDPEVMDVEITLPAPARGSALCVQGKVVCNDHPQQAAAFIDLEGISERCGHELTGNDCYELYHGAGIRYGPAFRLITLLVYNDSEALAMIGAPETSGQGQHGFMLHPCIMDSALQAVIAFRDHTREEAVCVPFSVDEIVIRFSPETPCYVYMTLREQSAQALMARYDAVIADSTGKILVEINGLVIRYSPQPGTRETIITNGLHRASQNMEGIVNGTV